VRKARLVSVAEWRLIFDDLVAGGSLRAVATARGISVNRLYRRAKAAGVKMRPRGRRPGLRVSTASHFAAELMEREGASAKEAAARFGVTRQAAEGAFYRRRAAKEAGARC
jgi:transposase